MTTPIQIPKSAGVTPKPSVSPNQNNSSRDHKNLETLFGQHSDPKVISHFCSILKQCLPVGDDPNASINAILATLKDMFDEGQLPDDKTMEEAISDRQRIDQIESVYVQLHLFRGTVSQVGT